MPADLTAFKDHPVKLLAAWLDDLPPIHQERPGGYRAQEVLAAHEREQGVTYVALHNDTMQSLREAYDDLDGDDQALAMSHLVSAVRDLLGLGD